MPLNPVGWSLKLILFSPNFPILKSYHPFYVNVGGFHGFKGCYDKLYEKYKRVIAV